MTTAPWHADGTLLTAYAQGRLDAVLSASLERHVDACPTCHSRIAPLVSLPPSTWEAIRSEVESPPLPWIFRGLRAWGVSEPQTILLAASVSLRAPWLVGAVVALGFAALATIASSGAMLWPFLLVAPLIPVLGIAAAYDSAQEPFEALVVSSPYGRPRLILLRAVGVLVTSLPAALLIGLALPGPSWLAVAWLGPALAMVIITLAVAGFIGPRYAAVVVALFWLGLVLGSLRLTSATTWPVAASQQLVYLVLTLVAGLVILARSRATRQIGVAL